MDTPDRPWALDASSHQFADSCSGEYTVEHHRRVSVGVDRHGICRHGTDGETETTTDLSGPQDTENTDATGRWTEAVVQYDVKRGTKLQECAAIDGYGSHQWTAVSVAFTTPVAVLNTGTLSVVFDELFESVGVAGKIAVPVVSALATLWACNITVGCIDVDLPFSTPAVLPTVSQRYGTSINEMTGLVPVPGVHRS
jgi:hypothetical protein